MKNLLALVFLLFGGCNKFHATFFGNSFSGNDKEITFIVAGQSNGTSALADADQTTGEQLAYSITGNVTINRISPIDDDFFVPTSSNQATESISWIYLGDMIAARRNCSVKFMNVSVGGTSTEAWRHLHYVGLMNALRKHPACAILWVQGEREGIEHISAETSYQNLKWLIDKSHEIQPEIVWYIALDAFIPFNPGIDNLDQMPSRIAQRRVIKEGLARQGPDIDILRDHPYWSPQPYPLHFGGAGFKEHAKAWERILGL